MYELGPIGRAKRINSVQPEKNSISRKNKKCCTLCSCFGEPNGQTERGEKTEHLMWMDTTEDGYGHNFIATGAKSTLCADSAGEAQDFA